MTDLSRVKIGIVGLGYVGLPLAVEFGKQFATVGFDINGARIQALQRGEDATREMSTDELQQATRLTFASDLEDLRDCNVYIVTVPTPIDASKRPDLSPLILASEKIGSVLKQGDTVIYESTVYPGCTEEACVPILERTSGLTFNVDFFAGYSPERINPGDKQHRVAGILKITSGSTPATADFVNALYAAIITAGTHRASSIKVAEAAKVIENTQRDVNIALMNDLALLLHKLDVDTLEVLEAAGTKWNFMPFRPGLVGGHCIGVDPFYLAYRGAIAGHHPAMILAGRRANDCMGPFIANETIHLMMRKGINPVHANILVLGLAFKENCPDIRNTRVVDIVTELRTCNAQVDVHDPWADPGDAQREYGIDLVACLEPGRYDAIIVAVAHQQFVELGAAGIRALGREACVIYDVKYILPREAVDGRL